MEKQAFEPTGLIPRSIIRTVDRFVQQLLPGKEKIALQEYRVSRYQILVSIKSLLTLILIPLLVSSTIKALIFTPLVEHFWNNNQNEIFLNQYQERRAFSEMHDFSEKMFFESLLIEPKSRPMVIETENFDHIVKTLNAPEMKNQKYMSKASDLFENQKSVGVANCTKDFEFTVCPHNYSHKHEFSYKNYPVVCHIRGNASSIYENTPSFPLTLPLPGNQEPQRSSMCMPCLSPLLTNRRKNLLDFLPYSQIFVRCTYVQTPLGQKQISHKHKSSLPLWGKNKSSHKSSICACACVANLRFARACEKICEAPSLPTQIHKSTNQRFDFPPSQIYTQISDLCLYSDLCRNLCLWENKPLVQGDEFINYSKQKQRLQIENIKLQLNAFSFALPYTESSLDYPIRNTVNSYKQNYLSNIPKIQNLEMRIPSAPKTHKHKEGFIPFVPVTLPFMSQQQWDYPHKHNYPRNIQFVNKEEESNFALENLHFVNFENDKYQTLFQLKSLELAKSYNKQSILAITNLLGDFLTFFTVSLLFRIMRPELIILKSFLTESVYSLSDTTKSFLLILGMDLLVGFHSPRGWELLLEGFLRHIGLPENENFILLFVALFPVFLDTVFKYWIFRYLNKISPSTVVTYHSMIE